MRYFTGFTLCLAAVLLFARTGLTDVTTNPSRLVLTQEVRAGEIQVHNSGHHTLTISTGWTAIAQGNDGLLYPAPYGPATVPIAGLQMWPNAFTLKPDETRAVYVVLPPENPIKSEQLTHIRIDADRVNGKGPRWGLSLPVFVRAKYMPMTVQITEVRRAGPQSVFVTLFRHGGATPYGKLVISDERGRTLGELGNITLYADKQDVRYEIPLEHSTPGTSFISYLGSGEFENQVFDIQEIKP